MPWLAQLIRSLWHQRAAMRTRFIWSLQEFVASIKVWYKLIPIGISENATAARPVRLDRRDVGTDAVCAGNLPYGIYNTSYATNF